MLHLIKNKTAVLFLFWTCFSSLGSHGFSFQPTSTSTTQTHLKMTSSNRDNQKVFAPSRFVVDSDNHQKYRLCAAAAVLNSQGELLVGERTSIQNAWQAPQGGVDANAADGQPETIQEAASRELYEEMGLQVGKHVVLLGGSDDETEEWQTRGLRYETSGTSNWLTKAGFVGQQLHWVFFQCVDGRGDADPRIMCDLAGQNGEAPEFTQVAWRDMDQVLEDMWPAKRGPYEALQKRLQSGEPTIEWKQQCQNCRTDFAGYWTRDNSRNENLKEALLARGLSEEQAEAQARGPYRQHWQSVEPKNDSIDPEWQVITYADDNVTPRRTLIYPWGSWEETYEGQATLFGTSDPGTTHTLYRRTFYAPQPSNSNNSMVAAHVTMTKTPKGDLEESRRYRQGPYFVLKRTFWSAAVAFKNGSEGVVSYEYFVPDN